jgi:hypothetical protein
VLGHDNLEVSADWPGAASAFIEETTGGVAPFLLGAHADVDPRTRAVMDLAIDGQSRGLGFDAVRVLGREVAEAVLAGSEGGVGFRSDAPVAAAVARVSLAAHLCPLGPERAREELEARKRALATELGLRPERFPRTAELFERMRERVRELPPDDAREQIARMRLWMRDRTATRWLDGRSEVEVEVQALRIAEATLLALPLEPTVAVGLDWRRRAGTPLAGVIGIGNGWLRYLPHADDLAHPRAHWHYEVLSSLFEPEACERLLGAGEKLAERLEASAALSP